MSDHSADTPNHAPEAPITVLLVDDQRIIGLMLGRLLKPAADIVLHHCLEAERALASANDLRPDVILQDLVMDIDGLTVVGAFRRNASTASTPIVVLSGNDDATSRARAANAGANGYLVKLPSSDALIACIRGFAAGAGLDHHTTSNEAPVEQRQ